MVRFDPILEVFAMRFEVFDIQSHPNYKRKNMWFGFDHLTF